MTSKLMVGFRGQVFVDTATHSVRRISLQAEDLPKGFPTVATVMGVDYDYVVHQRTGLPDACERRVAG